MKPVLGLLVKLPDRCGNLVERSKVYLCLWQSEMPFPQDAFYTGELVHHVVSAYASQDGLSPVFTLEQ